MGSIEALRRRYVMARDAGAERTAERALRALLAARRGRHAGTHGHRARGRTKAKDGGSVGDYSTLPPCPAE